MFPEKFQILSTHISYRTNLFFCSIIYMLATTIVPSSTGCCSRLSPMFIVSARSAEALKSDWTEVELMLVRTYGLLDWNEWKIYRKNSHANSYITLHSDVSSMLHVIHILDKVRIHPKNSSSVNFKNKDDAKKCVVHSE